MTIEDLEAALQALGFDIPGNLAGRAEMAARQVLRDQVVTEKLRWVDFPANTEQVEHDFGAQLLRARPSLAHRGAEISHDATHIRLWPALTTAHRLAVIVNELRFDGTLEGVPAELEDAVTYAVILGLLDRTEGEVLEVATETLKVKRAANQSSRLEYFRGLYADAVSA